MKSCIVFGCYEVIDKPRTQFELQVDTKLELTSKGVNLKINK